MRFIKICYNTIGDYQKRVRIFWSLVLAIVLVSGVYVFLINQTVVTAAELDNLQNRSSELESEITYLEFEYISKKSRIDMEMAISLGFGEISTPHYVSRDALKPVLTKNTARH